MKKKLLFTLCIFTACFLLAFPALSQEIRSTQYDVTPLNVNPVFTGMFDGGVRVSGLYRTQWNNVNDNRTYGASVDLPVFTNRHGSYLGVGMEYIKDQVADGILFNTDVMVSTAWHQFFGLSRYRKDGHGSDLAVGMSVATGKRSFDISTVFFGKGIVSPQVFAPGIGYPQNFVSTPVGFYSVNAGASFSQSFGSRFNYTAAVSGNNLNEPTSENPRKENEIIGLHKGFSGFVSATWNMMDVLSMHPSAFYINRTNFTAFIIGDEFEYIIFSGSAKRKYPTSLFLGGWLRTGDIATLTGGFGYRSFRFGLGYDFHSFGAVSTSNGSLEVTLKCFLPPGIAVGSKRAIPSTGF